VLTWKIRSPVRWLAAAVLVCGLVLAAVVRHPAHASAPTPLLANLVADPPDNVSLGVSSETPTGEPTTPALLLRFNGYVHNVGPGALDFRGSREAPKTGNLAFPAMNAFQRLYFPGGSTYVEEPSPAEMIYVNADGHHHWHLQRVAFYSLWNSEKTAEVAPAQKVGFCLEDSEHVEPSVGPSSPVYADNVPPYRDFCQEYKPEATSLFEGISPGWRDRYTSNLAFQWVDVSNVLPGSYWLREDVNTTGVIKEAGAANTPAYATSPTIVPGFDALAQSAATQAGEAKTLTLAAKAWGESSSTKPKYTILSPPPHGTLSAVSGGQVTYTPAPGYSGLDSFTFAAAAPSSAFPLSPAVATVSIDVAVPSQPSVAISGAPSSMIASTSVQLFATVANDSGGVTWSASAGSITPGGLYTAPGTAGGVAIVKAQSEHGASDEDTIAILPVPIPKPAPEAPPPEEEAPLKAPIGGVSKGGASSGASGTGNSSGPASSSGAGDTSPAPSGSGATKGVSNSAAPLPSGLTNPRAVLIGRRLIMTTEAMRAGRIRLSAYLNGHRLGTCVAPTPGKRTFTCGLTLAQRISLHAPIAVWATLRVGSQLLQRVRPPGALATMKMSIPAMRMKANLVL
jgi:hypothetical protein